MHRAPILRCVVALPIALAALSACKKDMAVRACEEGAQGKLLAEALDASGSHAFNEALGRHGPVQATELPCLQAAVSS